MKAGLRRGGRAHRPQHRPPQERHLPHRRRGRPRHPGPRGQGTMQDTCPTTPGIATSRQSGLAAGADRSTARSARRPARHLPQTGQADHGARPGGAAGLPAPAPARWRPEVAAILKNRNPAARSPPAARERTPAGEFLWAIFRDVFHYCALHLADIADNAATSTSPCAGASAGTHGPVRDLAGRRLARDRRGGHPPTSRRPGDERCRCRPGCSSARACMRRTAPTRRRRCAPQAALHAAGLWPPALPEQVLGEAPPDQRRNPVGERRVCACGARPDQDARIGIVSITSKMHAIGDEVLDGMLEAIPGAERELDGLVIWQSAPFAVGANLPRSGGRGSTAAGQFGMLEQTVAKFQRTSMAIKHARCRWWPRCRAWRWAVAASSRCMPATGCGARATSAWSRPASG